MASTHDSRITEDEPLLGQPGDVAQQKDSSVAKNVVTGTAVLAQVGAFIIAINIWVAVFSNKVILFSYHPLFNSLAVLLTTQAILVLQPTHTPGQKTAGTLVHSGLNALATLGYVAAAAIILYNKADHPETSFKSVHAIMGLVTWILLAIQGLVGATMYYTPNLYGSVANAKSIWKYHRLSGYIVLTMALASVCAATTTDFNVNTLHVKTWAMVVAAVLVVAGTLPRVKLQKLGLKK